jgi:hypothetical protein
MVVDVNEDLTDKENTTFIYKLWELLIIIIIIFTYIILLFVSVILFMLIYKIKEINLKVVFIIIAMSFM